LSSTNDLNRKLEDALGMTREYDNIAELWNSFHQLMRSQTESRAATADERGPGLPGTGGHVVRNSRNQS
jgi:DASH complex subunit DAD1